MRRTACYLALVVAVLLCSQPASAVRPVPLDLRIAPDMEMTALDGKTYSLSQFRGHMIALHFWASWCVPCRREVPMMARFIHANPGAVVIPVSVDATPQAAMHFLDTVNASIPLMFAPSSVAAAFGVRAIPTTIILDRDRRMLYRISGAAPWDSPEFRDLLLGFRARLP